MEAKYFYYLFVSLYFCSNINGEYIHMVYNSNSDVMNEQYKFPSFIINTINGLNSIILEVRDKKYEIYLNETGVLSNMINYNKRFLGRLLYSINEMEDMIKSNYYSFYDPRIYPPNYQYNNYNYQERKLDIPPMSNPQPKLQPQQQNPHNIRNQLQPKPMELSSSQIPEHIIHHSTQTVLQPIKQ